MTRWKLTDLNVKGIVTALGPKLKTLKLMSCNHLTDTSLAALGTCPSLQRLNLSRVTKLSTSGLEQMLQRMSYLTSLDLSYIPSVGTQIVRSVALHCRLLQTFRIRSCLKITNESLRVIGEIGNFPNLRKLDILACQSLTKEGIDWILLRRPLTLITCDHSSLKFLIVKSRYSSTPFWDYWKNCDYQEIEGLVSSNVIAKCQLWTTRYAELFDQGTDEQWMEFHRQGKQLAVELKAQLGDAVEVWYDGEEEPIR